MDGREAPRLQGAGRRGLLRRAGVPLGRIDVPTLVLASLHDIHSPADEGKIAARIPGAKLAMLERGSHMAMYDNQDGYFGALTHFIDDVEAAPRRPQPPAP